MKSFHLDYPEKIGMFEKIDTENEARKYLFKVLEELQEGYKIKLLLKEE